MHIVWSDKAAVWENEMKSDCQCDVMVLIMCTECANIINNQTKSNVIQLLFSWHSTPFYY